MTDYQHGFNPREASLPAMMLSYIMAGFAIFPLNKDRTPRVKSREKGGTGWQNVPRDPLFDVSKFPFGYGIVLTDSIMVLDYDPRRDPDGTQLQRLWDKLKLGQTDTYVVKTGRGGSHIYFHKPSTVKLKSTVPNFPSIEIKSKGNYVVGPGSPHHSYKVDKETGEKRLVAGKPYYIAKGSIKDIKQAPKELLEFCIADSVKAMPESEIESDDEMTVRRFVKHCQTVDAGTGRFKVACKGRDFGLSEEKCFEVLMEHFDPRCATERTPEEVRQKVSNAYQYAKGKQGQDHPYSLYGSPDADEKPVRKFRFDWDSSGKKILPTLNNVLNYFRMETWQQRKPDGTLTEPQPNPLYGLLRFNRFSRNIEFMHKAPWRDDDDSIYESPYWTDDDAKLFKDYISREKHLDVSVPTIHEAALVISKAEGAAYHPVKEYLNSLTWDGIPRLDTWLTTYLGAADTPIIREFGKNFFIALCARIYFPGCQHDTILILEGIQGRRKSTCVRIIGGKWYKDVRIDLSSNSATKDTIQNSQGGWVLEFSELEFMKKTDVPALKRYITLVKDDVRLPYEKHTVCLPRQWVGVGTVNPSKNGGYFRDETGNRRFCPVYCHRLDPEALKRDRDQLFAEAKHRLFDASLKRPEAPDIPGEPWWITDPFLEEQAIAEQSARMEAKPWTGIIESWLARNEQEKEPEEVTPENIAYQALGLPNYRLDRRAKNDICDILRALHYNQVKKWCKREKRNKWVWVKDFV